VLPAASSAIWLELMPGPFHAPLLKPDASRSRIALISVPGFSRRAMASFPRSSPLALEADVLIVRFSTAMAALPGRLIRALPFTPMESVSSCCGAAKSAAAVVPALPTSTVD